ncbi:MAG: nucleoside monophosphate kinase [Verrucomicrobia bacterium]|nr:nucleoside monophosphate kinase [Verrucomicrobiota bacterium]
MFFILLGPPGGGKGTQGALLADYFGIPHISSGNLVRHNPDLTEEERAIVREGKLLPDSMMIAIVERTLKKHTNGWILDGFPRTLAQAEALEKLLTTPPKVLYFDVREEVIQNRISFRRSCKECDAIYHLQNAPPRLEGVCDKCQGALFWREDDTPEVIKKRLMIYHEKTAPLIAFYKKHKNLLEIDCPEKASPEEIFSSILSKLQSATYN